MLIFDRNLFFIILTTRRFFAKFFLSNLCFIFKLKFDKRFHQCVYLQLNVLIVKNIQKLT